MHLDFHGDEFNISGDMWALRQMGLHQSGQDASMTFFQSLFANEVSQPSHQLQLDHVPVLTKPVHGSSRKLPERINPFIPLNLDDGFGAAKGTEMFIGDMEDALMIDSDSPSRKRSRTSSMGECEESDMPMTIHS